MVLSPITHKPANLYDTIDTNFIINKYKQYTGIDVSNYFKGLKEIYIYKCNETGYRFFYPFNLTGDDKFYEELQKYPWYYADWKWDYTAAIPHIPDGSKVLDIGCGYGNFLQRIKKEKNCDSTGLEFNDKAIETGKSKGLTIYKEFIQEHAEKNPEKYDVVCFFQVLEHVADIDSFVSASIKALKPNGKLIVCVPNNNPYFYKHIQYDCLNIPPHHMGWWDETAFRKLCDIYPITVTNIHFEKLNRFRLYTRNTIKEKAGNSAIKKGFLTLFYPLFFVNFLINARKIDVGSILVVYEKNTNNK